MGFVRFLLFMFIAIVIGRALRTLIGPRRHPTHVPNENREKGAPMVQDPYCETYIPASNALGKRIRGEMHYFCSAECADSYEKEAPSVRPGGAAERNQPSQFR